MFVPGCQEIGAELIDLMQTTNVECERLFKVNLISHFVLIREFLPGMLKQKKGHIVTIASMASFVAAPGLLDYCCSKVGALYLSEGMQGVISWRGFF
jgi:short-subunit dehydrogenase